MFESVELARRTNWKLRFALGVTLVALCFGLTSLLRMTLMPLRSYSGVLPPLSQDQTDIREHLSSQVHDLSVSIGERNLSVAPSLRKTADYLRGTLQGSGYSVTDLPYSLNGHSVSNLEASLQGSDPEADNIVVGAHYDSVAGTVGANDNATGVAGNLELARLLSTDKLRKTVRFVFFVNEEPPYFQTHTMGSFVYAHHLRLAGVRISAMLSLETIGFYSDASGSQKYPALLSLFYPSEGNFIGFVGNSDSRELARRSIRVFRESVKFPSEGIAAPAEWPGIGWSDQWSFWREKYPGIMITDTAVFRYPHYHTREDTFENLDFDKMARVLDGVRRVVETLANEP